MDELLKENSIIQNADVQNVIKAVYSNNEVGLDVFLTFLEDNLLNLKLKYADRLNLSSLFIELSRHILTLEQLSKVSYTKKYLYRVIYEIILGKKNY